MPGTSASDSQSVAQNVSAAETNGKPIQNSSTASNNFGNKVYDSVTVGSILFPHIQQVSSQGCSRVFIIKGNHKYNCF